MIYEVRDASGVAVMWTTDREYALELAARLGGTFIAVGDERFSRQP